MGTRLNVLMHDMVPKHQIMDVEEVHTLLTDYNLTMEQLLKIYHDDPIVKSIDAVPGNVIRITRKSHTAGEAEAFRLVVRRPKK
ncbi:MAG: DNA-directed RNA polymerase subunit H [Methanomicrobiales archaeon 53_19]|jgi:DNA-directed RNA polymerase subunit H|uniref:DNA-directed RNA polymerase subunit H n=1 Tax=Methanocalculus sp. TaxID=2004547 RepID=UPI000745FDD0|nr:DNA-directed RNA polymerase subunit H [Methanocalculus sp.]KUL04575.1 MAG: DNA-directed RNA polymerase subunit H [Methanomicrobiales archaeon 53_19]HIJ06797.1 DNA-directed RNA polymerase subunit H [Methanocalculus sp.]